MDIKAKSCILMLGAAMLAQLSSCGNVVVKAGPQSALQDTTAAAVSTVPAASQAPTESTTMPATEPPASAADAFRGNIYDCGGKLLMYSSQDSRGGEVRMTSDTYKVAFANVLSEMSEGLDLVFDETLRTPNPTPVEGIDRPGQSIQLTFDADRQNAVYSCMESLGIVGSAVVMRSDGSLLAEVSCPSYDPDLFYGTDHDEDLAWGTYGNKAFQNAEPGSCFKIMSEVIADKHGVYSLYDDGEWVYDGTSIVNWDHDKNPSYPIADRSLYSAFVNSSNIFFAKAFDQIGSQDVLTDLNDIFHFGKDINCDFGELHNNIEVYCDDDLRRTAFGQSYVLTCPIYLAALGREAVFGEMVTPFVLKNAVDSNDFSSVIQPGTPGNQVIAAIPSQYRQNLLDGMTGVASGLGISVPAGYRFYAKTGTAETWMGDFLYITGILKNDSDDGSASYSDYTSYGGSYIIVMQVRNPESFGFSFASESAALYQAIVNAVVN